MFSFTTLLALVAAVLAVVAVPLAFRGRLIAGVATFVLAGHLLALVLP